MGRSKGKIIYVIGASGSGKDSILKRAFHQDSQHLRIAKRYITRPQIEGDDSHIQLSEDAFNSYLNKGDFAMHWHANGYQYGIDNHIFTLADQGLNVLINGSRQYAQDIKAHYPHILVVMIAVDDHQWQQRLIERGRETKAQIEARIHRHQNLSIDESIVDATISNNDNLEAAVEALLKVVAKKNH